MPGKVKVKIVAGRNLPIMDRSNLTTDAYVEVKLGSTVFKTEVYRKSLNPIWNSEWYRFEMDDLELQDEPLQIRLMDHDTYSSNDAIGKVYLDLNPLLCNSSRVKDTSGKMISGWIPVYDTMHGIRGEVNLIVKVELFSDLNKFRQSSCGVRFFFTQSVPEGYIAHIMQGFVEELVVNDDPEYQWIDKIRTPRASNEARQTLFSKLSGEVQRRVGLKALELGGNAVIGYKQCFDLEGESGIVVRGIGTAVYLTKQYESQLSPTCGETLGLSREFAELHGYRSFAKCRGVRRRGGPNARAPRLHRRSFRMPSSSDSVSEQRHHPRSSEDYRRDDGNRLTHAGLEMRHLHIEKGCGIETDIGASPCDKRGKERSSSFREDSLSKLAKLRDSLTTSSQSVRVGGDKKNETSCPPHESRHTSFGPLLDPKGLSESPSYMNVAFPVPHTQDSAPSTSTAFKSCSTSVLSHSSHSPLCKSRRVMERTPLSQANYCTDHHRLVASTNVKFHNAQHDESRTFEGGYRSRSALASCMMHHRTCSDTMTPTASDKLAKGDVQLRKMSKSVNELSSTSMFGKNLVDYVGSESAGSNIDSNVDEDSTSDTSMRYVAEGQIGKSRMKREVEFESDTSKDMAKVSSGNEGCSIDNDELSPVSERDGFLLLRKKRGSKRKDRYSKSSLMKRASANFADRSFFGGTERIKEEVVKFFKRKKSSDDNESCSSSNKNASTTSTGKKCTKVKSPYRETKFFFRKRRTPSNSSNRSAAPSFYGLGRRSRSFGQLFRSNSESHSIGQTSLDSMPSVGSEPLFDPEDDDSSHGHGHAENVLSKTATGIYRERVTAAPSSREKKESRGIECSPQTENVIQLERNEAVQIIEELGYSTESPINLYISSRDALLVYDPRSGGSGVACTPSASAQHSNCNCNSSCRIVGSTLCPNCSSLSSMTSPSRLDSGKTALSLTTTDSLLTTTTESSLGGSVGAFDVFQEANLKCSCFSGSPQAKRQSSGEHVGERKMPLETNDLSGDLRGDSEHVILYRTFNSSAIKESDNASDDEILVVMSRISPSGVGGEDQGSGAHGKDEVEGGAQINANDDLHANTDGLAVTRSPIPEELLERGTPTALNNMQTGGASNFNIPTTNTNHSSSHPAPSTTVVTSSNLINSNNHHGNLPPIPATGRAPSGAVSGEAPTGTNEVINGSKTITKNVSEESTLVARNESGNPSADDAKPKPTFSPSSHPACDPQHYHCQANGCPINHRLQYLHQQQGFYSQEMSIDTESSEVVGAGEGPSGHATSVSGSAGRGVTRTVQKTPPYVAHHMARLPPAMAAMFPGPNHANMTTTVITSGTGTMPMVMGSGGPLHRRSSESDLSTPPKPTLSMAHVRNYQGPPPAMKGFTALDQYGLMEYPFITISQFPPGFLTHIGGTVTARSVKLLERISNLDEPESRDAWWNEIRMEIRAHCRAFGCTVVVGYEEHTTMCDDVCVLSASGTAAMAATTIGLKNVELLTVSTKQGTANPKTVDAPCPGRGVDKDRTVISKMESGISTHTVTSNGGVKHVFVTSSKLRYDSDLESNCSMLHIPANPAAIPFPVKMSRCQICRRGRVPEVLISTISIPPGLHITGKGTLIQAQVFRPKKDCKGESSAKEVSDSLPFLEYELHRRLINKLKVKGMNAIFGLKVQICLGDKLMVALATGTAMYVTSLPPPGVPIITAGNLKTDAQKVIQYQKVVQDAYDKNRQIYDLKNIILPTNGRLSGSSGEDSEEEDNPEIQSSHKETYILEVDDAEDIDIISMLIDPHPAAAFFMNNIDYLHGYEEHHVTGQQMFSQVWRCRIPTLSLRQFTAYFERLIRSVCFKLRKMMPCVISKLSFRVDIPEQDEMQIALYGLALAMTDHSKVEKLLCGKLESGNNENELMFPLEDDGKGTEAGARGTVAPGILIPVSNQSTSGARHLTHQSCMPSSSPHSLGNSQSSGNGSSHVSPKSKVNGSSSPAQAPPKYSGGTIAGTLASSSNPVPGHGHNYGFRGASNSQHLVPLSRTGSKVIHKKSVHPNPRHRITIEITPLSYIPGKKIEKYLGNLNFFFIRETTSIRESGGLSGFVHNFVTEVLAIVRAHVSALGGNAMVSYFMTELALLHNPHKNQGQCLINVGGDVVSIAHPPSADDIQFGS